MLLWKTWNHANPFEAFFSFHCWFGETPGRPFTYQPRKEPSWAADIWMIHSITSSYNATDWTDQEAEFALGLILKPFWSAVWRQASDATVRRDCWSSQSTFPREECMLRRSKQTEVCKDTVSDVFAQGFCRRRSAFPLERMQIILTSPDSSGALTASGNRCRYVFEKWQSLKAKRDHTHLPRLHSRVYGFEKLQV